MKCSPGAVPLLGHTFRGRREALNMRTELRQAPDQHAAADWSPKRTPSLPGETFRLCLNDPAGYPNVVHHHVIRG